MEHIAFYLLMLMPISQFIGAALSDILLSVIAVLFIVRSAINRDISWFKYNWLKAALALWFYLVVRSFFSEDYIRALKTILPWIRFIIFAAAVSHWLLVNDAAFERFAKAICITLLAISLNTISQFLIGADIFGNQVNYEAYPRLFTPSGKLTVGIMTSFYILPLVSVTLLKYRSFAYYFVAALALIAILLSGERTAFILTAMGVFLIAAFSKISKKQILLIAAVAMVFCAGIYLTKKEVIERQVISSYNSLSSYAMSSYGIINTTALAIFQNGHEVFGIGPKHYNVECRKHANHYMTDKQVELYCNNTNHPHNIYLEVLLDGGLVGFVIFIIFVYFCIQSIFESKSKPYKHFFGLGAGAMVILKLFPAAPISSIYFAWSMAPFWLMLGAVSGCHFRRKYIQ